MLPIDQSHKTTENAFHRRVQQLLATLGQRAPSLSATVDLWRPAVVSISPGGFIDNQEETWTRIDEGVPAFTYARQVRWYQADVGVVYQREDYLVVPSGYQLQPEDHVILRGDSWMIIEAPEQYGVCVCKIDRVKSRFKRPMRYDPVYRQTTMKASIA